MIPDKTSCGKLSTNSSRDEFVDNSNGTANRCAPQTSAALYVFNHIELFPGIVRYAQRHIFLKKYLWLTGIILATACTHSTLKSGDAAFKAHRFTEAVEHYSSAVSAQPNSALAHERLGMALALSGRAAEAIIALRKAIELDPSYETKSQIWKNLGHAVLIDRGPEEALPLFQKSVKLDGKNFEAINSRGLCLLRLGRFDEAASDFDLALTLSPRYESAAMNRGTLVRMRSMSQQERQDFFKDWNKSVATGKGQDHGL